MGIAKLSKKKLHDEIIREAKVLGIHSGTSEIIADKVVLKIMKWREGRSMITEEDLNERLAKELAKYNEDLSINRKELSKIVFNDEVKMKLLCEATYGFMVKKIDELISDDKIIILDYALLPKTKYYELCDLKILVQASYDNRSNRVVKRDNVSFEKYSRIDANSVNYSDYYFDYIIENNSDMDSLRKAIGEIYEKSIVSR